MLLKGATFGNPARKCGVGRLQNKNGSRREPLSNLIDNHVYRITLVNTGALPSKTET